MKYIQRLLFVQIILIQSIFGIQYYRNEGDYFTIPMYTNFSARPTRFNNNSQPQAQSKIIPEPQLNLDYYHHNYDDEWKEPPRFFCDQPQSNVDYGYFKSNESLRPSYFTRMPLALMSTKELAQHFAFLKYSQEQILDEYQLYSSDAFIGFIKDFPEYEATLKKHCQKFAQYGIWKKIIEFLKGDYPIGLADRLKKLCDRLPKISPLPKESTPTQQQVKFKKADFQLVSDWRKEQRLHETYLPESAHRFQTRIKALSDPTIINGQSAIQRVLTQESDDLRLMIETEASPLIREHAGALRMCIDSANEFAQLKNIETASKVLDFCWSVTELGKALAIGTTQGLSNAATNALDHPIELAVDVGMTMTVAILAPHYLCVYHTLRMIHYLAPTIKDLTNIGMTYRSNSTQGIEDFKTYIAPITNFVEKIKNKEIALTQLVESGAMVAAQFYADQKLYGGISSLYGSITNKALTWAKNNPALQLNDYLKTADGLILKAVQGIKEPLPKERVTQTLHRTEDFFIATEFGKANKNNFQRSIYGHDGKRAFQAMKNFDHIKKKQYIVLDGLHKNHLEVYGSNKEWLKVLNFDGTFNEHLTAKAQLGDPRNPLSILG